MTTKRQQQPKGGGNRKMNGIESSVMPFVSTVGFGGIVGFLIGFTLKRIMKILAVIAGVFFAALLYLESQHIANVNWDKIQTISNSVLSTITTATTTTTNATSIKSQAFIPLGAYLLFVGIFTSAKNISRDSDLRKEFYKSAASQLSLLKAIGVSQMEKELEKQVKSIEKRLLERTDQSHFEEQCFEEENVKEILHDVLNELYYSKGKEERHGNHNHR
jgi:uncharacterized membrane protein (Fun14 family)